MKYHSLHGRAVTAFALVGTCLVASCSSVDDPVDPGSGGSSAGSAGTSSGTAGLAGTAGVAGSSAGTGGGSGVGGTAGAATGGSSGAGMGGTSNAGAGMGGSVSGGQGGSSGAAAASGTAGTAGTTGGTGGTSGAAGLGGEGGLAGSAGAAGSSAGTSGGGAGGGGGLAEPDPSSGCSKANPQTGSSGSPLNVSNHQYYVKLPTNYDPNKPYPTLFMFNPTNNPINWAEQNAGFESNGAKDAWIRVYPHPANPSSGWGANDVSFFAPLYDSITNNFCVDKARVFAAGESSGGDFSSILGCEHADKVRAIGPCATKNVQQYPLNANTRNCTGQVAAVIIHGKNDNVVGPENGPLTRDFYVDLNHCESMSMAVDGYTDMLSNCVEYQGCDEGFPVFWCQHTDPEYGNTNHGWPRFAAKFLFETFSKY